MDFADGNRVPARIVGHRPERGRGAAQDRPAGPVADAARRSARSTTLQVGDPVAAIGSPFGEEQSLSVGRHLRARPQHRVAHRLRDRRRDPDRRRDQPRQLRRPAARRARPRDRHQRADQDRDGRGRGRRLRDPGRRRASARSTLLREDGEAEYGYLGVSTQELYPQLAERLGLDVDDGRARRPRSWTDSPADDAGPRRRATARSTSRARRDIAADGDVIVAVDGDDAHAHRRPRRPDQPARAGREVELGVLRDGERRTVEVELGERPQRRRAADARTRPRAGARAAGARAAAARRARAARALRRGPTSGDVTFAIDAAAEELLERFLAERAPEVAFYSEDRGPGRAPTGAHSRARRRPDRRHAARRSPGSSRAACRSPRRRSTASRGSATSPHGCVVEIKSGRVFLRARRSCRGAARLSQNERLDRMFWTFGFRGRPARELTEVLARADRRLVGRRRDLRPRLVGVQHDARRSRASSTPSIEPSPLIYRRGARSCGRSSSAIGGGAVLNNPPYDLAAAALALLKEAGAVVTDARGEPLDDRPLLGSGAGVPDVVRRVGEPGAPRGDPRRRSARASRGCERPGSRLPPR